MFGLILRLLLWFLIISIMSLFRLLQFVVLAIASTIQFLGELPSQGFHKAELNYRHNLQGAIDIPWNGIVNSVRYNLGFFLIPVAVISILGIIFAVFYFSTVIEQHRRDRTRQLVDQLAEGFCEQTAEPNAKLPNGFLPERDAWRRPVRLKSEKTIYGWNVTVSSDGPDGLPETWDDIGASKSRWESAKAIGGELAKRGVEKVEAKVKQAFAAKPVETTNDQGSVEVDEEEAPEEERKWWKFPSVKLPWGKSAEKEEHDEKAPNEDGAKPSS